MIDLRPVFQVIGIVLCVLAAAMVLPALLDLRDNHGEWRVFAVSAGLTLFAGLLLVWTLGTAAARFGAENLGSSCHGADAPCGVDYQGGSDFGPGEKPHAALPCQGAVNIKRNAAEGTGPARSFRCGGIIPSGGFVVSHGRPV